MKKVFSGVGHIVLAVFTVAIVALMAIMNYQTLGRIFPDDPTQQIWGMVLFTGGTLSWFAIFLMASRGPQRPIALVMFGISLIGEVLYAAADVIYGGQSWVKVDNTLGTYAIYFFILLTFAHGGMLYIHFLTKPEVWAAIDIEAIEDDVKEKAQTRASELINAHVEGMADQLAGRVANTVFANLRLPMPAVIDGVVLNESKPETDLRPAQAATEAAKNAGWFDALFPQFGKKDEPTPAPAPPSPPAYTLNQLLFVMGMSADDARAKLTQYGLDKDVDQAFDGMSMYNLLPAGLNRSEFRKLHTELFASAPEDASATDAQFRGQAAQNPA